MTTNATVHRGGRKAVNSGPILKYLSDNLGLPVHTDDLIKNLGLTKDQIHSSIYNLKNRRGVDIETIIAGEVYRLRGFDTAPKPAPAAVGKRLFEELGTTKQGVIVAQDQDGVLYKVEEL
jgi:hypothetical protein